MQSPARKPPQTDYRTRVDRVNLRARFNGVHAPRPTSGRPVGATLLGFAWIYVVIAVGINRPVIESSLRQGSLPDSYHTYVFAGLTILLVASGVLLTMHLLRFFTARGPRRTNSGGILVGALGAVALFFTPDTAWQTGARMLDDRSRAFLTSAGAVLEDSLNLNLASASYVTSAGR